MSSSSSPSALKISSSALLDDVHSHPQDHNIIYANIITKK